MAAALLSSVSYSLAPCSGGWDVTYLVFFVSSLSFCLRRDAGGGSDISALGAGQRSPVRQSAPALSGASG